MSEEKAVLGGMGEPREPTEEDQSILDKVKEQYEKQSGTNPGKFKAILVGTQVVAGTNYFFKVDIGEDTYIHVRVFVPLPASDEGPTLESFQADKTKDDKLELFKAKDEEQAAVTCSKTPQPVLL
ncbi:leukocyte cysteine proteinase inhibitor 1-like [Rana temporaria]|uniref:leukocyte cysteine proteinase inhibitor 1-like n=1 Tax=Rana temporaria TaxID=8407 RepID=UPI001AACB4E8|nr:leukocyte cysteine proteinase inhibitor 1-like [Rana temporaria]